MRKRFLPAVLAGLLLATVTNAGAVHWYRNTGSGCSQADGELTDPGAGTPTVTAEVRMLHNAFEDGSSGSSVTTVAAGEAVRWTWNSAHCHSAQSTGFFNSGFHYPKTPPETPPVPVVPLFFEYPLYDDSPTLSYVHTFTTPGTYAYFCIHHQSIGMKGTVVVV